MRYWLYNFLMWLLLPLWIVYSWRRCKHQTNRSKCWRQLWCFDLPNLTQNGIWIHAVSLGEAQVALSLLRRIRQQHPLLPIFFTGGNKSAVGLAAQHQLPNMSVSFLPIDYAFLRRKLFKHLRPKLLLLIETELWPNLLIQAHQQKIPVAIIQARLSKSSRINYPRYGQPLLKQMLSPVVFIAAQTEIDKACFIELGTQPEHSHCLGNLKYDLQLPEHLEADRAHLSARIGERWIWVAGSTHPTEEIDILAAHQLLLMAHPNALLILAPRQMSHVPKVVQQLKRIHLSFETWSQWHDTQSPLATTTQVLLIDTLGALMIAYACADACFVGGSLVPWGGHNLLEPAALSKPIVAGPYNHNFSEIEQNLLAHQGMIIIHNPNALMQILANWLTNPNPAYAIGQHAHQCFKAQQGTMKAHLNALSPWLSEHDSPRS
jgi:3-deoxy-D-manno-octulosonic-acid transferase